MGPCCLSSRRRSSARWRRWTDGRAWPPRCAPRGPVPGCKSVADTRLLAEGQVLPASQLPPLWSICVQEGGGSLWGPTGFHPLLCRTLKSPPSREPTMGLP